MPHDAAMLTARRQPALGPADTRAAVAHLVRRAAFGATAEDIDALAATGYEAAVDQLCELGPDRAADAVIAPTFDTAGYLQSRKGDKAQRQEAARIAAAERRALPLWWVRRMVAAERPLREKLTLLWHDHFATSIEKVKLAELLYRQRQTLYELGPGRFDELVHAIARDPAMLIWLDGRDNRAGAPNENFARELFELFTLGLGSGHGTHGPPPFTEDDVAGAARSLTGWTISRSTGTGALDPRRHDTGDKTVLGATGALGLDEVVAAATRHPACAPHVVARLYSRLARPARPDDPVVVELAAPFAADLDVRALLRRIFLHPDFVAPATRAALVKTPIDLVVGLARALRFTPDERVVPLLAGLGQLPFLPPDVAGWPANEGWLSTASALLRLQLAEAIAGRARVDDLLDGNPADRAATLARLLGVERWSLPTAAALASAPDARAALTLAIVAPEHLVG
jgi:uncharacterized protein (DUF1800 family)